MHEDSYKELNWPDAVSYRLTEVACKRVAG